MASVTKAAAKVAGKTKGAAEALAGYPKIFHHLAAEHTEVSVLMKRIANSAQDSNARQDIFPELCKNLLAHAHAEEEEFYPVLTRLPELEQLVSQCIEDHRHIDGYLQELHSSNMATKTWTTIFERLMKAVESHVEREENDLFPKASDLLSNQQASEMYRLFENVEEREKAALASTGA